MPSLLERVAGAARCSVGGQYYRHAAPNRDAFAGGTGGRWGAAFPVIYLGRPQDSVTVEAYRHLVEATGIPARHVRPRVLYTVTVQVDQVLDLTDPHNLAGVGLRTADLSSEVDDYQACQEIAAAAHQLEYHGVLAPAATGLGTTLALFVRRLQAHERPVVTEQTPWEALPPDPRVLRIAVDPAS
jgi:hypothetical protein